MLLLQLTLHVMIKGPLPWKEKSLKLDAACFRVHRMIA